MLSEPDASKTSFLLGNLQQRWRSSSADDAQRLTAIIGQWQEALWKFNSIGHIGREGGPKAWMEAVVPITSEQELRLSLPESSRGNEVSFYLATGDAGDGNDHDYVIWKNLRLEGNGLPPLLIRDAVGAGEKLAELRARMLSQTARYLAAAVDAESEEVGKAAQTHDVDPDLLRVWLSYLKLGDGAPVLLEGHFTNQMTRSGDYEFINGWGTGDTPSIIANSSDQEVRIPGIARPHSIVAHPSPTLFAAIGWRSPINGSVRVEADIADAHPECGNGVEWVVQHRTTSHAANLGQGEFSVGGRATMPARTITVRKGELVSLILGPRQSNHSCDLSQINFVIRETDGERVWDLAQDVSGDILAGNPHADRHGNADTWHFYKGEMSSVGREVDAADAVPAGSLLARWRMEKDQERRTELARRVQELAIGRSPPEADSADAVLYQQLQSLAIPLDHPLLTQDVRHDERFGKHPAGGSVDAADLVVKAPAVIEIRLSAELARGREVVASAQIDPAFGSQGVVQVQLLGAEPESVPVTPSTAFLVGQTGQARDRVTAAMEDLRNLFPPALCYARIVPVDEVVTLTLFHREDEHLQRLMLEENEIAELNRLWDELYFISQEPLQLVVAFEQLSEFATQDRPDLVTEFEPLREPINQRADAFRQALVAAEPRHIEAVLDFAGRAWRRRLSEVDRTKLQGLYLGLREAEISHEDAIRLTLARVLTSPDFLYRHESSPPGKDPGNVSNEELASRLSYFLWSSLPDAELIRSADAGQLTSEDTLRNQTARMLQDPRTRRLAVQFACQWLHVRNFDQNDEKNEQLYPQFGQLRTAMYEETVRFFEDMFRNDGSIIGIVNADHTFLNQELAEHYGIEGVSGPGWHRVDGVRKHGRGGVIAMATVLASQSGASRTSPILRGNWVYETLLGQRLPRPPAGVPQLPDDVPVGLTARELIQRHSSVASCAKCHAKIDPYGFALEQYDAIGRLRSELVDTTTKLIEGTTIEGIDGLRDYLFVSRKGDVLRQFCRKLLGYALGREVQLSDEPLLETMLQKITSGDGHFRDAVMTIVTSRQFRQIRGRDFVEN